MFVYRKIWRALFSCYLRLVIRPFLPYYRRYDRFIVTKSNLRRKKLHMTNQGSNFRESSFSISMSELQSDLDEEDKSSILKE